MAVSAPPLRGLSKGSATGIGGTMNRWRLLMVREDDRPGRGGGRQSAVFCTPTHNEPECSFAHSLSNQS
jgi:hypothetical protein